MFLHVPFSSKVVDLNLGISLRNGMDGAGDRVKQNSHSITELHPHRGWCCIPNILCCLLLI